MKMNKQHVIVCILLLVGVSEARLQLWTSDTGNEATSAPDFCRGAPCPPFKVISKGSTYELREYTESEC